ncbi:peptidoglycan-binding protein [Kitasatospora indigofera]|uniref:peptidoglycan-binding protein n=1 Tax=Kitasatospora indigofera TaxID=67307 RepID=UPI0036A31B78
MTDRVSNAVTGPVTDQVAGPGTDPAAGTGHRPARGATPDDLPSAATAPTAPTPTGRGRRGTRTRAFVIAAVAVLAALGAGGAVVLAPGGPGKAAARPEEHGTTTPIVRGDLTVTADVDGTLGYTGTGSLYAQAPAPAPDKGSGQGQGDSPGGAPRPQGGGPSSPSPSGGPKGGAGPDADDQDSGTRLFTGLPKVGDSFKRGDTVYHVNGRPVPLFQGEAPLWRALTKGVPDGPDVRLLEQNLAALGFGKDLQVDEKFTDATTAAVKRWQKSLGVPQTGRVDPSAIVVQPGPVRITAVKVVVGAPAQGEVAAVSGTGRQISVNLPVDKQTLAKQGDKVTVRLPDGSSTAGTITSIGTVAAKEENPNPGLGGGGKATVQVLVALDRPEDAGTLDGAPVTVGFTSRSRKDVLSVPVNALVALAEGGYAVEVAEAAGSRRLIGVKPGLFANGRVEIDGEGLREDQKVLVPSP